MKLSIFGTGYVGLVSGACLADFGHDVTCVDTDAGRIARLQGGGWRAEGWPAVTPDPLPSSAASL